MDKMPLRKKKRRRFAGASLRLAEVPPGRYAVEIWDCWTGEVVETIEAEAGPEKRLDVALPPFVEHCALKIRAVKSAGRKKTPAPGDSSSPEAGEESEAPTPEEEEIP